jgi:DNA-binding transcriptional MerR regulator
MDEAPVPAGPLRVGALARASGLTVRTLHHYDAIGLVVPSKRTGAGHRLYTEADVSRLYRVMALRNLGLRLSDIGASIEGSGLRSTLERQREHVAGQIKVGKDLLKRLDRTLGVASGPVEPTLEELIDMMEVMKMHEKYYTPEQLAELEERRQQMGAAAIEQSQKDWTDLIAEMRVEMEAGSDPAGPRVQELAERWQTLIEAFTGGNPEIAKSLKTMYQSEDVAEVSRGTMDREVMEYAGRAMAARQAN